MFEKNQKETLDGGQPGGGGGGDESRKGPWLQRSRQNVEKGLKKTKSRLSRRQPLIDIRIDIKLNNNTAYRKECSSLIGQRSSYPEEVRSRGFGGWNATVQWGCLRKSIPGGDAAGHQGGMKSLPHRGHQFWETGSDTMCVEDIGQNQDAWGREAVRPVQLLWRQRGGEGVLCTLPCGDVLLAGVKNRKVLVWTL